MVGANKRRNCLVVIIDNLDSTIKDVAFDYFVLNTYGNYDKIVFYNYLHANVTYVHGVCMYYCYNWRFPYQFSQRQVHKGESLEN